MTGDVAGIAIGGCPGGAVAVLGAVAVATLLDVAAVTDADRFALGHCLTT